MKKLSLQHLMLVVLLTAALSVSAFAAAPYADVKIPSTIRVTVSYNAGGSSDALARMTLPYWEKALEELTGQDVSAVVVNLPGAGGEIGWTALAHAQPDGSTIGIINLPAVPLVERARKVAFDPWVEKFVPLGVNVIDPNIIRVSEQAPYDSLADAIEAAKKSPGSIIVGADGPLSDDHLAVYALEQATGAKFTFIPFDGGAPANRAQRTGEVDLAIGNVFDYIQDKDVTKDAAIFSPERYAMTPEVATLQEKLGVDAGELGSTRGFAAPAGVPDDLLKVYQEAFAKAFGDPEYQKAAKERSITIVPYRVGDAFGKVMQNQNKLVGDLLQYFVEGGYIK